jgi:tRNA pseudouridine55 synthase
MDGILIVDKPAGVTSAQVVARVKRALGGRRKVGHTGTLDPMATGVLPLCVGEATKIAGYLLADDKAYEGELELGVETDTLDRDGEVVRRDRAGAAAVTEAALATALAALVGASEQVPPMYSALKRDGVRLHALARAGEQVDRPPRPITVRELRLTSPLDPATRRARFRVDCSKGTYVRALVRDIGAGLGCGACLTALRRTRSGRFGQDDAVDPETVGPGTPLVALADALDHLPAVTLEPAELPRVANGQRLPPARLAAEPGTRVRLLTPDGGLLALARVEPGDQPIRYERVFRHAFRPDRDG